MTSSVLIINPLISAEYLSKELKKYSIQSVALYTMDVTIMPEYFKPNIGLFDEQIFFPSVNIKDVIQTLGNRKFDFVINDFDSNVEIADALANHYTPDYANDFKSTKYRSNKYHMHQTLAKNGISNIKQFIYSSSDSLPNISKFGLSYPCFIKPLAAGGAFGATKINTKFELEKYFNSGTNFKNIWQTESTENKFLISEFIIGTEMLVDTFSIGGKHYISSIQKYHRDYFNSTPIYCYCELVKDPEIIQKVSAYILQVLNTTKFFNGFAHIEVFLLPDGDIKLIEINPRISGGKGLHNRVASLSGMPTQIDLLAKYRFNIETQVSLLPFTGLVRCIMLFNFGGHPLYNLQKHLSRFRSIYEINQIAIDGFVQSKDRVDVSNCVAIVFLKSEDIRMVESDTKEILAQDKLGWTLL